MTTARSSIAFAVASAFATAFMMLTGAASAHVLGVSRGDYILDGNHVRAEITLRADEAAQALPGLDADGDGRVSEAEIDRATAALKAGFLESLRVTADGAPCFASLDAAELDPPEGIRLRGTYACPREPLRLQLHFGFLDRMPSAHRHLATLHLPRGEVETLAVLARPDLDVAVSGESSHGFVSLFRGGIEHILCGADHLAFLLALVLGGVGVRKGGVRLGSLVGMLTAFTVGHSVSLAIATIGGFAPGARLVEPAVALSVAYVGAENLYARGVAHRWLLTLPFGLVHGFAFAGGLLPLGLPRAQLPVALFAFNLGVEAGQLVVLAALLPPLLWLCKYPIYPTAARALSAGIAIAGIAWFFQRLA